MEALIAPIQKGIKKETPFETPPPKDTNQITRNLLIRRKSDNLDSKMHAEKLIQQFDTGSDRQCKIVRHEYLNEHHFSKQIGSSKMNQLARSSKSKLFVQVTRVEGLWDTCSGAKKCRALVSVEVKNTVRFTKPSDNVNDPKFNDCFVFPVRSLEDT